MLLLFVSLHVTKGLILLWGRVIVSVDEAFFNVWMIFSGTFAIQVILFEIDCAIFYTYLHELFCQFKS